MSLQKSEYNEDWPGIKNKPSETLYSKNTTPCSSSSQASNQRKPNLNQSMHANTNITQVRNFEELHHDNTLQSNSSLSSNALKSNDSLAKTRHRENFNNNSLYWNSNELHQRESASDKQMLTDYLPSGVENSSHKSDTVIPEDLSSREKIVAQRRLKVAARRQMKKFEKEQLKQLVSGVQAAKPDFSLEQSTEDFPELNARRKTKKDRCSNNIDAKNNSENNVSLDIYSKLKISEKSWKPKVKDPICFNISQVLKAKPEKCKAVVRKADQASQRAAVIGNTLDGDCPQLKKGKVRPNKVKKPTKFKQQILLDRIEKRKASEEDPPNLNQEESLVQPGSLSCNVADSTCSPDISFDDQTNELLAKLEFLETDIKLSPSNEITISKDSSTLKNIHSRKFREYCTNCLTEDLINSLCMLLEKVAYFQDRLFARDPIKASAKRRYVAGFNQSRKYLHVKKVKLLIIAPDLEKSSGKGGLDEKVSLFKKEAENQGVPCAFGPNRKRLGRAVSKNALVSCVVVLSYDGAEEEFFKVMEAFLEAKSMYKALTSCPQDNNKTEDNGNEESINQTEKNVGLSNSDVTYSLYARLKEEMLSPADKLLNAIQHSAR